ncbi:unnamed protein product, partial [Rotaria sp. Silwood1]
MMIRLSKHIRQYFFIAFMTYLIFILLIFVIYFILTIIEKYVPIVTLYAYSISEYILNVFNLFSLPLRYLLPNLTDDEYYLILLNVIITIFSLIYAYLFYIIHPNMFPGIPLIQNTAYLQWFEMQRRRFQENHRAVKRKGAVEIDPVEHIYAHPDCTDKLKDFSSIGVQTLYDVIQHGLQAGGNRPQFSYRKSSDEPFQSYTY